MRVALEVQRTVTRRVPVGFQARDWIVSLCPVRVITGVSWPFSMSHRRIKWSPDADASRLAAVGWKRTCPTLLLSVVSPGDSKEDVPSSSIQLGSRHKVLRSPAIVAPARKDIVGDVPDKD